MELTAAQAQRVVDDIAADATMGQLAQRLRVLAERVATADPPEPPAEYPSLATFTQEMLSARISALEWMVTLLYGDPDVSFPDGAVKVHRD